MMEERKATQGGEDIEFKLKKVMSINNEIIAHEVEHTLWCIKLKIVKVLSYA